MEGDEMSAPKCEAWSFAGVVCDHPAKWVVKNKQGSLWEGWKSCGIHARWFRAHGFTLSPLEAS